MPAVLPAPLLVPASVTQLDVGGIGVIESEGSGEFGLSWITPCAHGLVLPLFFFLAFFSLSLFCRRGFLGPGRPSSSYGGTIVERYNHNREDSTRRYGHGRGGVVGPSSTPTGTPLTQVWSAISESAPLPEHHRHHPNESRVFTTTKEWATLGPPLIVGT